MSGRVRRKQRKEKSRRNTRRLKGGRECENKELDNHCGSPTKASVLVEKASRREGKEFFCCCCVSLALRETGVKMGVGDFGGGFF